MILIQEKFNRLGDKISKFEANHSKAPFFYTILSALFYVFVGLGVKMLNDFSPSQILYFRSLLSILINSVVMKLGDYSPYAKTKEVHKLLLMRCVFGGFGHYCFFKALYYLDISDAITIVQTYPFWTSILAGVILKEQITSHLYISLALGFSGILLVVKPTFIKDLFGLPIEPKTQNNENQIYGFINGTIYSICMSIVMILIRKLSGSVHNSVILQYAYVFSILISGIDMISLQEFKYEIFQLNNFLWVLYVAFFNYMAQIIYSRAILIEKATKLIPFTYSQVLFGFIIDIIVFGKNVSLLSILGASLIVVGNLQGLKAK